MGVSTKEKVSDFVLFFAKNIQVMNIYLTTSSVLAKAMKTTKGLFEGLCLVRYRFRKILVCYFEMKKYVFFFRTITRFF